MCVCLLMAFIYQRIILKRKTNSLSPFVLSIALVEAMHGTLTANSEGLGKGARFSVTLRAVDDGATGRGTYLLTYHHLKGKVCMRDIQKGVKLLYPSLLSGCFVTYLGVHIFCEKDPFSHTVCVVSISIYSQNSVSTTHHYSIYRDTNTSLPLSWEHV